MCEGAVPNVRVDGAAEERATLVAQRTSTGIGG